MSRKVVLAFLAGWALSILVSPRSLMGLLPGRSA